MLRCCRDRQAADSVVRVSQGYREEGACRRGWNDDLAVRVSQEYGQHELSRLWRAAPEHAERRRDDERHPFPGKTLPERERSVASGQPFRVAQEFRDGEPLHHEARGLISPPRGEVFLIGEEQRGQLRRGLFW